MSTLPLDLVFHIISFVSDVETLGIIASFHPDFQNYIFNFLGKNHLSKLAVSDRCRASVYFSQSWSTVYHVLSGKCELCRKDCIEKPVDKGTSTLSEDLALVWSPWNIFSHKKCLSEELMTVTEARQIYGISAEHISHLPIDGQGRCWKRYRADAHISIQDTVEGLCDREFKQSLVERVRYTGALTEGSNVNRKRKLESSHISRQLWPYFVSRGFRRERMVSTLPERILQHRVERLEKSFRENPGIPEPISDLLRAEFFHSTRMPCTWSHLEDQILPKLASIFQCWTSPDNLAILARYFTSPAKRRFLLYPDRLATVCATLDLQSTWDF